MNAKLLNVNLPCPPIRPVTEDEIKAFHRDGAVVLRGILQPEWVQLIERIIEESDAAGAELPFRAGWEDPGRMPARGCGFLYNFLPSARAYVHQSPAALIAAALLRARQIYYFEDQLLLRDAGPVSHTQWHQDIPYWKTAGDQLIRLWTPIDPVPAEVSLHTVRGSHLWNTTFRPFNVNEGQTVPEGANNTLSCQRDESQPLMPDFWAHPDSFDLQSNPCGPGDVLAMQAALTIHGVPGSDRAYGQRRVYSSVFAGENMVFHDRPTTNLVPNEYLGEPLAEGEPLANAKKSYPLIWPGLGA